MKIPMTLSQQGLWYLSQVGRDVSAAYNIVFAFEASSPLDPDALGRSLHFLMLRHPVLAVRVNLDDGAPQFELQRSPAEMDERALVSSTVGNIAEVAERESGAPFNFETGPLFKVVLVNDPEGSRCGLVVAFAHLVFDGASLPIFLKDLGQIYAAVKNGSKPEFRDCPVSQEELCRREKEFVDSEEGRVLIDRIATRIRDVPRVVSLPTRKARIAHRGVSTSGAVELTALASTIEAIRLFSSSNRISPAALHLATFEVLLWQYSKQNDFGVSFPINARSSSEETLTIGYLSNVGVVRANLKPETAVLANIRIVADSMLDALEERSVPFPIVVRELKQAGQDLQGPLMQIGFNYQLVGEHLNGHLGDVSIKLISSPSVYAKNELKLEVVEAGSDVTCRFIFDQESFAPSEIERMASQYNALLASFITNPQGKVQDLPLLTKAERHQMLVEWNDTKADFPQDKCIHQLFEEQVGRTPDAVAVVFEDQQLTYTQLNAKANQLARHLRSLGVKPDTLVAICVERSLEMVIGLLGILKAGGAYVPLDPSYPRDRLTMMVVDSRPTILLTQARLSDRLPSHDAVTVLLDAPAPDVTELSGNLDLPCEPQQLAYCIYTSGSTGQPKGALNSHEGLVNRLHWMQSAYGLHTDDVVLQKTPFSFDVSVWELFWPLIVGARLAMAEPDIHRDPAQLRDAIDRYGVTTLHFVPSMLQMFIDAPFSVPPPSLRRIFASGEALAPTTMRLCAHRLPSIELHNLYGPTECAVDVTAWCCPSHDVPTSVSIGKPIANLRIHVLDEQLQPTPVGVGGEIHIAGIGVGRGYLNRPEQTAEKFIPNPFGEPGSRMYKTGDLARYLPDGNIEFLGRIDYQVKIRGFRIELGEVEAALRGCEGVREAVVLAREDVPGDKRLVAYVVPMSGALAIAELRTQISSFLPEFMVPSAWVFLDSLPLSPNGKIDRKALLAPELGRDMVGTDYVAPRNSTEELLAGIWAEVLRAERISIDSNFFILGGHSLLAAKVIARLRQAGFSNVSLRNLLDAPTIRGFAIAMDMLVPFSASTECHPISRVPRSF